MCSVIFIVTAAFLYRGSIYQRFIVYHPLKTVSSYNITDQELQKEIEVQANEMSGSDIHEIAQQALENTAQTLLYSFEQQASDPNLLIHTRKAHCVGYAAYFTATCTALIRQRGLFKEWAVTHYRGQIYLMDYNLHKLFTSSFFRDHDYVILKNQITGEQFAVDPVLFEYTRIDQICSLPSP